MKLKFGFIGIAFLMLIVVSCGAKTDVTQYMTSREHFEYAMKFFSKKDYNKAQEQFSLITYKYSGSDIADDAQYYLALSYFVQDDYVSATGEYDRMISSYPRSEFVEKSMYELATCYFKLSPEYALDQKFTYDAIAAIQNFQDAYPKSEYSEAIKKYGSEIKLKLSKKHFESAQIYRKLSEFEAAIVYYDQVITEFYDSPFVPEAKFYKGVCNYKLDEFQKARLLLTRFIEEYPAEIKKATEAKEILEKITIKEAKAAKEAAKEAARRTNEKS